MNMTIKKNIITLYSVVCLTLLTSCTKTTIDENSTPQPIKSQDIVPVVILGGGIAGLTASIYLQQSNIPALVIEGPKPGGALGQSHEVNNWPGEYHVSGASIVEKIKKHALSSGATIMDGIVQNVMFTSLPYQITIALADGTIKTIATHTCIIAMGTEPNFLHIPGEQGEDGFWGRGVSNCAVCDGAFYKNKKVVVVGGGDSAVEQAHYLSNIASSVTMLIRKDIFAAKDKKALDLLLKKENVSVRFNTAPHQIEGDAYGVTAIHTTNTKTNKQETIAVDGVFLAIGSRPNTTLFKDQLELTPQGFIALKNHQETSRPGIFAAGDIADNHFVQAITAAGDGCRAALQAKRFLDTLS